MVTTGAVRRAKLQSNRHHQHPNIHLFYRLDALPITATRLLSEYAHTKKYDTVY